MKGTDVTDAQLAHAQEFLRSAAGGKFDPEFMESQKYVTVDKEDIIRLLAWYGAIRAKGGRETPAPLVHRTGPGSTMGHSAYVIQRVAIRKSGPKTSA